MALGDLLQLNYDLYVFCRGFNLDYTFGVHFFSSFNTFVHESSPVTPIVPICSYCCSYFSDVTHCSPESLFQWPDLEVIWDELLRLFFRGVLFQCQMNETPGTRRREK